MSVRKSAARTASRDMSGGAQALKSLGFWALLAGASFVIGLFILSPLINVAAGTHSTAGAAPTVSAPPSQPAPQPAAQPVVTPRRAEQPADSDVGINVEKPKAPETTDVQPSQGLDASALTENTGDVSSRSSRRKRSADETDARTDRAGRDNADKAPDDAAVRPDRGERTDDAQPTDSVDRAGRTPRDRSSDSTDESGPRRTRRARRTRSGDESSPPKDNAAPPTDVQKGDSIDR